MQIFKNINIDFVSKQSKALLASAVFVLAGVIMIFTSGIKLGIDFTGGVEIVLKTDKEVPVTDMRNALQKHNVTGAEVKTYGAQKISISLKAAGDDQNQKLVNNITTIFNSEIKGVQLVGEPSLYNISGKMSDELIDRSVAAIIFALVLIALYIIVRFSTSNIALGIAGFVVDYIIFKFFGEQNFGYFIPLFVFYPIWKAGFAFGAIVAVFHDVVIALSLLELTGVELSATVIAALLTIIGYSLNDTIVVYDRIRENLADLSPIDYTEERFKENINTSINTTLNRTVVTSLTTFFVVLVLSMFGGEPLFPFAITLCYGVVVGTYSSIFIAAPIMMKRFSKEMEERKQKLISVEEEENPHDPNNEGIVL